MKKIVCVSLVLAVQAFGGVIEGCKEACAPFLFGLIESPSAASFEAVPVQHPTDSGDGTWSADVLFVGGLGSVSGTINSNPDPFLDYSFGVMNLTSSDLTFSFLFLSPYAGGPFGGLKSSHASSVTDGGAAPNGAIVISPDAATGFVHNPVLDGAEITAAAVSPGCALAAAPGFSDNCQGFSLIAVPISSGLTGLFGVRLQFTVSPGDLISLVGRVELLEELAEPIPEPAYAAIVGLVLVALSLVGRFRRA